MENTLVLKYQDISLLVQGSTAITVNPQGEELLVQLLQLQKDVERAIISAKKALGVAIEAIDPDMTSVSSDRVKVAYRVFGPKYRIDENCIDSIDPKFYTEKKSYSLNAKELDKSIKESGILPNGISIVERSKTVSITLKEDKYNAIQDES